MNSKKVRPSSSSERQNDRQWHIDTEIIAAGRDVDQYFGFVNPPIYRGSTVIYPSVDVLERRDLPYTYGRRGTPTTDALEAALTQLEGGAGTVLVPSGMAAVALALQVAVKAGDHVLVTDSCYQPTRAFCETWLRRFGVETEYFDPCIGSGISALFRDNTAALFLESPGSQTFEMQDVPAMAAAARESGIVSIMDNTWATALYFRPIEHGVDLSVQAGTKYIGGHSDIMLGAVTANAATWPDLKALWAGSGMCAGPETVYLAHRGLRTLAARLERHMRSAIQVAHWLEGRPEIDRILHPALESHPGHALWKRDFAGSSGLFSVVMKPGPSHALAAFLDHLELFGLGFSWGGYESLAVPFDPSGYRSATRWRAEGPAVRLHVGLEAPADLISDLEEGLKRWRDAGGGSAN